jgi:PKD repeat protein
MDHLPPEARMVEPAEGVATANRATVIVFHVVDPLPHSSLLNLDSLRFSINGVDLSDQVFVSDVEEPEEPLRQHWQARVSFTPTAAHPLPEGELRMALSIADNAGNGTDATSSFKLDTKGPLIQASSPAPGSTLSDPVEILRYAISDEGVGLNPATVRVTVNGTALSKGVSLEGGALTLDPGAMGWPEGALAVSITAADQLGNTSVAEHGYTVAPLMPLTAKPRAIPSAGEAPLSVTLVPEVVTRNAIERYEWDFQNDGTIDRTDPVGQNQRFTYTAPGQYDAWLRVTDNRGERAVGMVRIQVGNRPPVVSVSASPSNGAPPLKVTFSATATDSDGIALHAWDFNGDGTWDQSGAAAVVTYLYTSEGTFQPRLRVTDKLGAATEVAVPSIEIRVVAGAPTVVGTASPVTGNTPLAVSFNATATDPQGRPIASWAWDFDGDGTYEHTATSPVASHSYRVPGTWYPRVRAVTEDGRAGQDVLEIKAQLNVGLRVLADTIDLTLGQTSTIETTLGGNVPVSLIIESRAGETVRTLVPFTERQAGTHADTWDGKDDQGRAVRDGDYRAILLYRVNQEVRRFDLGLTTGGVQSNPPRSPVPNRFSPLAGQPLRISYTLDRASDVTAFMGQINADTRFITFLQRAPRGRGSHQIVWNGENADGRMMHPPQADSFLFGIFAYTLPDNAIFVRSGVHASALSVAPAIFDPTGLDNAGKPTRSTLRFTLSRPGNVELIVANAETGAQVLRRVVSGLGGGEQIVAWDGRTDSGHLAAPGRYRVGIAGIDEAGVRTTAIYALQRVFY